MLTFSRLGQVGRLGNQLFQVAFITSFAERYGIDYALPEWPYSVAFKHRFHFRNDLDALSYHKIVSEPSVGYCEDFFVSLLPEMRASNVNIRTGYFQSCKYFTKAHALKIFQPVKPMRFDTKGWVAISVRRGDFVTHPFFVNVEADMFRKLLEEHFPKHRVIVFSDDYIYCRAEFVGPQYEFCEGYNDMEQLQIFRLFENYILSNSTFSYWGPMLSPHVKKVLYPLYMFPDMVRCDIFKRDYWPQNQEYIPYINPINKPLLEGPSKYNT